MLQQMREWFRYLKFLLVIVIFMFIVWAFASWSGGGAASRKQDASWAAMVNGQPIAIATFQSYARRLDSTYQSLLGEQYAQQRSLIRIGQQAINALVEQELMYQEALNQGIRVSPQEMAEMITHDPNFQENGRFIGVERYRNLFRGGGFGLEEFERQIGREVVIEKFRSLIQDAITVSDAEVEREFRRRNEKATVEYVVVDPATARSKTQADEASITKYYEAHRDRYSRGEGRTGLYVIFSPSDLATSLTVTDEQVAAAYERDRASRYTVGEQRRASHILFKVDPALPAPEVSRIERKAREVLKRARAGEDFARLARNHSEDSSAGNGGDLNFFSRGQMVKEFEEAAFSLPVGGLSDLVRTTYGFHIIKVTEARPARTIPLEEVRDGLRDQIKLELARGEALKRSAALARAAAGGTLEAVAKSQGLTTNQTGPVYQGGTLPGLAASQPVVARMLTLAPGEVSDPVPIPAGSVVVQVTEIAPAAPSPLEEVRARIVKDLEDERARATVEEAIKRVGRSGGLKALARALKTELKTQSDATRDTPLPGLPPDPAIGRQIFGLQPGTMSPPLTTTAGIVVLGVKERRDAREDFESQKDSIRDALARQGQERFYRALMKGLRDRSKVMLNEPLIRSLDQA
jgi:peptidyl-prolyl cis-trans isomerase D